MIDSTRVGHLAPANAHADPHVVAVCFVQLHGRIYTPIDQKPKSGRTLTRIRNIEDSPKAALVVDRSDEDWTQLAWVQARGSVRIVLPGDVALAQALAALRDKYPQYRLMDLESAD